MSVELIDRPLNETAETVQIVNNGQIIKELVVNEPDREIYFDIERMKQMIGETDENGCAKHTISLPKGLNKEQLSAWLDENIPAHLENRFAKRMLEKRALV